LAKTATQLKLIEVGLRKSSFHSQAVIARLDRAIQYAAAYQLKH
jgi:hypothetical protein